MNDNPPSREWQQQNNCLLIYQSAVDFQQTDAIEMGRNKQTVVRRKGKKSNQDNGAGPVRVRFSCQNIFIYSICLISHCPVSTLKNTDIFLTDDNETS